MPGTRATAADAGQSLSAPAVTLSSRQRRLRRTLECLTGVAFTEGNELTVLRNGDRIFPAMLHAIDGARRTVDLMTYVYWKGDIAHRFAESLAAAAGRGVRVRSAHRRGRRPTDRKGPSRPDGHGRRARGVVPQALAQVPVQAQPSMPPQGARRRRAARVHRRGRHRRRVVRRRAQPAGVARHPRPRPRAGGRRAVRGLLPELGRERPRAARRCGPVPRPAAAGRRRGSGRPGLSQPGLGRPANHLPGDAGRRPRPAPAGDRVLRPRRLLPRAAVRGRATRRRG